ncbi:ferric iron uptake transcriptional regulator [Psychromonas sp.]|uniref:ferric iron uptake transcriptional regulator n=1 Tax=Psychromonas sp. TaxID=1884585 RepID=UPI003563B352
MSIEHDALKEAGLKITSPRVKILSLLQQPENQHISAEDLYKKLLEQEDEVGVATVYRVLNQFDDAGIVTRHHFEGGKSVFELANQHHHDHLVCLTCGEVIEFNDNIIEQQQKLIAEKYGIKLTNHSLYLYGEPIDGKCNHKPK